MEEAKEDVRNRILNNICDLNIRRVPKNTIIRFREIANNDDFCKDYGMALKYLIDLHDGIVLHANEQIMSEIENIKNEIGIIKKEVYKQEQKPIRKMMDGTPITKA